MQNITRILGHCDDPRMAAHLHKLAHDGAIEYLHIAPPDIGRHRFRAVTDCGTECAIALPRDQHLGDGCVLLLETDRAIVLRLGQQRWLRLRPLDSAAALELGFHAGNLHWKVRFEAGDLLVAQDGPLENYLARLAPLLDAARVLVPEEREA